MGGELDDLMAEIKEIKAILLRLSKLLTSRFSGEKLRLVLELLEESPDKVITVEDVMKKLSISRQYALQLMDKANMDNDVLKISGHSRCLTRLYLINPDNKEGFLALHILKSLKKQGRGSTKRISAIMTETGLDLKGVQTLIGRIIKISNYRVKMDFTHKSPNYKERRIKNYGL